MLKYPYIFWVGKIDHQSIFIDLKGKPLVVDMSSKSFLPEDFDINDQVRFQQLIEAMMGTRFSWGVSSYLENREWLLTGCPQMVEKKRFFHLGVDVIAEAGTILHSPLNATVYEKGYEVGKGNYGGYVLLKHQENWFETFYSLYGHLRKENLPETGSKLSAGDAFAEIGDFNDNGGWFHHTHIQVITQKGIALGYKLKGYCSKEDLPVITDLCPSPVPLFISGCSKSKY